MTRDRTHVLKTNAFAHRRGSWTPYVARESLLSPAELRFFRVLRLVVRDDAVIFVKVRLADLIECGDGAADHHFRRIAQKHIDFVLCHPASCRVIAAVELDDASHLEHERRERDRFVDEVLAASGILLIHHPAQARYTPHTVDQRLRGAIRAMSGQVQGLARKISELIE